MNRYEIWPAQHDWLRRYFVFERATYALEEFLAAGNSNKFNGLSQKTSTVQQTVQRVLSGKPTFWERPFEEHSID